MTIDGMTILQPIINTVGSPWFLLGSIGSAAFIVYLSPEKRDFHIYYVSLVTSLSLLVNLLGWVKK